jgi:cytochrome d ubiquinol oxidase subunit I
MEALELARWQFAITTVFHFFFVPVSIGLSAFVAIWQTAHVRTGKPVYDRMARFWGKLLLIVFAIGVATGIVQEFQFGMNWSTYSRYVGDIFGAPLAMEGLAAFFVESTFLGLWIFGRDRLSPRVHLACIWMVAFAALLSAYFILAANAWMQHPVGYVVDPASGHAHLTSIWKVLTNSTTLLAFPHTILAAWATAGMVVAGVCAWHLRRRDADTAVFGRSLRLALPVVLAATLLTSLTGHFQAELLMEQQPMKMAAAEALFTTRTHAPLSLFATGDLTPNPKRTNVDVQVGGLLSWLSTGRSSGTVHGINDLNAEYAARYGKDEYAPIVAVTYWSFRAMIGSGIALIVLTAFAMWRLRGDALRGDALLRRRRLLWLLLPAVALPFVANSAGWIFTEMGRQPWIVQGLLKTSDAVSPTVDSTSVWLSMLGFTALYGILALIGVRLFARTVRTGPDPDPGPAGPGGSEPAGPVPGPDRVLVY